MTTEKWQSTVYLFNVVTKTMVIMNSIIFQYTNQTYNKSFPCMKLVIKQFLHQFTHTGIAQNCCKIYGQLIGDQTKSINSTYKNCFCAREKVEKSTQKKHDANYQDDHILIYT